jgi:hypothetical protein
MSEVFNPNEQALAAVLNEAKELGVDLAKLAENVSAGIMGNKPYTWVSATNKSSVLDALNDAIKDIK